MITMLLKRERSSTVSVSFRIMRLKYNLYYQMCINTHYWLQCISFNLNIQSFHFSLVWTGLLKAYCCLGLWCLRYSDACLIVLLMTWTLFHRKGWFPFSYTQPFPNTPGQDLRSAGETDPNPSEWHTVISYCCLRRTCIPITPLFLSVSQSSCPVEGEQHQYGAVRQASPRGSDAAEQPWLWGREERLIPAHQHLQTATLQHDEPRDQQDEGQRNHLHHDCHHDCITVWMKWKIPVNVFTLSPSKI